MVAKAGTLHQLVVSGKREQIVFGGTLVGLDSFSFGFVWYLEFWPLCSLLQQRLPDALPGDWSCHFIVLPQSLTSSGWIWAAVNFAREAECKVETRKRFEETLAPRHDGTCPQS